MAELVERGALEKRYARKGIEGSNPSLSANFYIVESLNSCNHVHMKKVLLCSIFFLIIASFFWGKRAVIFQSENLDLEISVYNSGKTFEGTTLLTDGHDPENLRIIEVSMKGEIVWEYVIPRELIKSQPVGFDAETLENGNVLFVLSGSGVYEVDSAGNIVWSYQDAQVSHDADRLENGNTLINFGNNDKKIDAQIKEVNSDGEIVWEWMAKDVYGKSKYSYIKPDGGWTHANAVERLNDGSTMVSLRNFYLTTVLDADGKILKEFDWSIYGDDTDPHEPEINEAENTLLTCLQNDSPYVAVEINVETEEVLWTYTNNHLRTARDCDKLPNGNVLIVAVDTGGTRENQDDDYSTVIEVDSQGEIVWRLDLINFPAIKSPGFFFKAERK